MTTYKNFDVLLERTDRSGDLGATAKRGLSIIQSAVGKRITMDRWGVPSIVRSFVWAAFSRAEIGVLRTFLAARKGRAVPVWVSTDNADLTLALGAVAGSTTVTVKKVGYSTFVFATGNGRRHLAVRTGETVQLAKVIACRDNLDGTETLTLDTPLTANLMAGKTMSYLVLCRLESDTVRIAYVTPTVAEASLNFVELPKETP